MNEHADVPEIKKSNVKRKNIQKDSLQYNAQDLSQDQRMDMNPVQSNLQSLHIYIDREHNDLSGKITGITCYLSSKEIVRHAEVILFFGSDRLMPVYRTNSDMNGNFAIDSLPPGFYTLMARSGDILRYQSGFIKVLPGQTVYETILLKE